MMAPPEGCPGVIVSSNPAAAVEPYAMSIYRHDLKKWDSLFPWEFPQNGSREGEESFLRRHFTEMDIYMHGGVDGEGKGFRFLKSVWYTIAIWNLQVRVPAVEKWFWEQPGNVVLLHDPDMNGYYLRPDALATTFFDSKEIDLYGEKFLTQVIPKIQATAKIYLQQRQHDPNVNILDVAKYTTDMLGQELRFKAATPAAQEAPASGPAAKPVQHLNEPSFPLQPPAPIPAVHEDHAYCIRNFSDGSMQVHDFQSRGFKRGGYGTQRFNRGGHYQSRGAIPFDGRHLQQYNSPTGGVPAIPVTMRARRVSGGMGDYVTSNTQSQQLNEMHQSMQRPFQYPHVTSFTPAPHNARPYGVPHPAMEQPVWAIAGAYHPHSRQQSGQYPAAATMPFYEQNNFDPHHRRNSVRGRGKGSYNGVRRGSQGRNSFGTSDYNMQPNRDAAFEGFRGGKGSQRARRFSGMSASWRSGSDHPQLESYGFGTKENMEPGRAFSGPDYSVIHGYDGNDPMAVSRAQMKRQFENVVDPEYQSQLSTQPFNTAPQKHQGPHSKPGASEDDTCGPDWISPTCTIATKLIANNVPGDISDHDILTIFRQYGEVENVKRHKDSNRLSNGLVFINFKNAQAARMFLDNKPSTWLDDRPLNLQVAKEFWDRGHATYQKRIASIGGYQQMPRRDSGTNPEVPRVPTILRRSDEHTNPFNSPYGSGSFGPVQQSIMEAPSGESTPTQSRPSTPRKKKNNKNNKKKFNADGVKPDDLRKTSLTGNADRALAGTVDENVTQKASDSVANTISTSSESGTDIPTSSTGSEEQRPSALPTQTHPKAAHGEAQSSDEPTFSPDAAIKTRLPSDNANDCSSADQQAGEELREICSTDIKHAVELIGNAEGHPFRVDTQAKKTEKTSTPSDTIQQVEHSDTPEPSPPSSTSARIRSRKEVSLTDTSFHTASDSPSTSVETKTELSIGEKAPVIQLPKATVDTADVQKTAPDTMASSSSPPAAKTAASVVNQSPQASTNPELAISTVPDEAYEEEKKPGYRSNSGSTHPPLTPAFITAPNTPAVGCHQVSGDEDTKEDAAHIKQEAMGPKGGKTDEDESGDAAELDKAENKVEAAAPKSDKTGNKPKVAKDVKSEKTEKAKGPAQTESLSLFGRKKEKKPKPSKKGSMKGKPDMQEKPSITTGGKLSQAASDQMAVATQNKPSSSTKHTKLDNENIRATATPDNSQESFKALYGKASEGSNESNLDPSHNSTNTSPSKGKAKLTTMFNRYFRGGAQSQTPALDATSPDALPSDDLLTPSKEQGLLPESVTKQNDDDVVDEDGKSREDAASLFCGVASPTMETNNYVLSESKNVKVDEVEDSLVAVDDAASKDDHGNGTVKSKKKKRKPKKKQPFHEDDTASVASTQSRPRTLQLGESKTAPSSPVGTGSPASSATHVGDTDSQPPRSSANSAKTPTLLVPPNINNGGVIQPKLPTWMKRKQPRLMTSAERDDDDEVPHLELHINTKNRAETADDSSNSEDTHSSDGGATMQSKAPNRILVYVGPGRRSEIRDAGEGFMSKQEEREMARRRLLEREVGNGVTAASVGGGE